MEITREKAMEVIALADMKMLNEIYQIVFNNSLGNSAFDEIRRILINGEH